MKPINVGRVLVGGLVCGILMFLGDGLVHGVLLKQSWIDAMTALGRDMSHEDPSRGFVYHVLYDLAKGFAAVFLYAAMRPRFGKGPKTAVIAGVVVWALAIPISLCGMIPSHFIGRKMSLMWSLYALVPHAIAGLAGGALYKEND